jgi:hypothetical protein
LAKQLMFDWFAQALIGRGSPTIIAMISPVLANGRMYV